MEVCNIKGVNGVHTEDGSGRCRKDGLMCWGSVKQKGKGSGLDECDCLMCGGEDM